MRPFLPTSGPHAGRLGKCDAGMVALQPGWCVTPSSE